MSDAAAARTADAAFSPKVAIMLFLVGVFAFSAFITLSSFAPTSAEGDAGAHALSRSAIGYAGIVKLARLNDATVRVSRTPPLMLDPESVLLVVTPEEPVTMSGIATAGGGPVLIVLPKWLAIPHSERSGWVGRAMTMSEQSVANLIAPIVPQATLTRSRTAVEHVIDVESRATRSAPANAILRPAKIDEFQTIAAPGLKPVAKTKDGKIVLGLWETDDGDIYVLSEPDLLNNHGVGKLRTAEVALDILNMLRAPDEAIVFDVTLNGYATERNLLRLAFEPPLLAATLSFALVAALIAWRAATRDGPSMERDRALAYGKRILADNSAALVRLAGREHTMAPRYADFIRALAAERIGVRGDGSEATAAELDRFAAARNLSAPFSTLAAEANAAQTGADALAAARKLHAWTEEMIRATR